jgi:hypothetical protein
MMEMNARLRDIMETEAGARIVPEAYEHTDTSDLIQPPTRSLVSLVIAMVVVLVSLLVTSVYLYVDRSRRRCVTCVRSRSTARWWRMGIDAAIGRGPGGPRRRR